MAFGAAGASILQGIAQIGIGRAERAQGQQREAELKRDAELAEIAGKESAASRLEELGRTFGTIRALMGARNINPDSPSAMALEETARRLSDRDRQREGFNVRQGASNLRQAGKAAKQSGKSRATAYYLGAGSSFLKSGTEFKSAIG